MRRGELQLLLIAPDELKIGDVDDVARLDTQAAELGGDAARFQKSLEPLHSFLSGKIGHAGKALDSDSRHREMMTRQAVRIPRSFVDIFEGVSSAILWFFDFSRLLLDLAEEAGDRLKQLRDALASYRRDRIYGVATVSQLRG